MIEAVPDNHNSAAGIFNRHRVSRTRRTVMGVRVEVAEGEQIGQALRRLRRLMSRDGKFYHLREREWRLTAPSQARRWKIGAAKDMAKRAAVKRRRELGAQ